MRAWTPWLLTVVGAAALIDGCVIDTVDDCYDDGTCVAPGGGSSTGGATTSAGGSGAAGGGLGGGGMTGCTDHVECTEADAARCDEGSCIPCTESEHCAGVAGAGVCEAGICVQCGLSDDDACNATQTCNLLTNECVDVAPGDVGTCEACTNDAQCTTGRCVPLSFGATPHGYYCLEELAGSCTRPFAVIVVESSINQTPEASYCGINQNMATCEAVLAHVAAWTCSGTDGMCLPTNAMAEVSVPGAVCETVGGMPNRCTYQCDGAVQCTTTTNENLCGTGSGTPPGWCGG